MGIVFSRVLQKGKECREESIRPILSVGHSRLKSSPKSSNRATLRTEERNLEGNFIEEKDSEDSTKRYRRGDKRGSQTLTPDHDE